MFGAGSPMRKVSPLVAAATPRASLRPEPPASSGLMNTLAPRHNRAPKKSVDVTDVLFSAAVTKLLAPVYGALNEGLYWWMMVVWAWMENRGAVVESCACAWIVNSSSRSRD